MATVRETVERIPELGGTLSFCELNFPSGQVARVRPAALQQERQLRLLKWKCTYEQAGCFESVFLAQAPEDVEE